MDCKAFARLHSGFIDDTLPGVEMAAMREHLALCPRCATKDSEVRRALLVLKNLAPIEVSTGFQDRLNARLAADVPGSPVRKRGIEVGPMKWAAAAALLIAAVGVRNWPAIRGDGAPSRLPPVIASVPPVTEAALDETAPTYMASMSTGIPMWPALMLAEEGPLRFAAAEASRHHD